MIFFKAKVGKILILIFFLMFAEFLYFSLVYFQTPPSPEKADLVMVFGGHTYRSKVGLELANRLNVPLYLSETYGGAKDVEIKLGPVRVPVVCDPRARTTDQNARNAADPIRKAGYHRVVLVTSWYHMPRSLFLARLYLLGSGVEIVPYPADSLPARWWKIPDFYSELIKFWGSLGRAGLAVVGVKTGPK